TCALPILGMRDRSEIAEAAYDVLRNLRRYRQMGESGHGPAMRRLAILGLAATKGPDSFGPALEPAEQAWLDRVWQIDPASLPRAVRFSVPDWLDAALSEFDDAESLLQALNQPAPLDLRVNPMKGGRDTALAELNGWLSESGSALHAVATPWSPWGMRLSGHVGLNRWSGYLNGLVEVQDEGSQLLALLMAPKRGEMIIDFCAGAGGKTLLLGALMRSTGRLYAFDVSQARLARLQPR